MEIIYNPPSRFTIRPAKTRLRQMCDTVNDIIQYTDWVQVSEDMNAMKWLKVEDFLEVAFQYDILDNHFVDVTFEKYKKNSANAPEEPMNGVTKKD